MEIYHGQYMQQKGYASLAEYYAHIERHPDEMDPLAVMLIVMLNHVHVCVHSKDGMWHTHYKTRLCACSLHIASMGNNTYVALQRTQQQTKEPQAQPAAPPAVKVMTSQAQPGGQILMTTHAAPPCSANDNTSSTTPLQCK